MSRFSYLHAHSEYSLTDGCLTIEGYVQKLSEFDIPRAALTDTHNLFGAMKFAQAAENEGIQPIIGVDLIVRSDGETGWGRSGTDRRLRVFVQNRRGYRTLCSLISRSYRKRHEKGLAVGLDKLAEDPRGLLFLGPPGPGSEEPLPNIDSDSYRGRIEVFSERFGDRAGVEVPVYAREDSLSTRLERARQSALPAIPTHPTYFLKDEQQDLLRIRRAIQTNTKLRNLGDLPYHRNDQYFLPLNGIKERLPAKAHDLLSNTMKWTEDCSFCFETGGVRLPDYPFGSDSSEAMLRDRCESQLDKKPFEATGDKARERLEHELETIESMGFSDYFLIVADVVNWARKNGIRVGPGRGSAAGSFVAYLMDITTVDPFRYDLIFERFLNPDRNEMPDIDVDFADHQRGRVLEYLRERFGSDHVAHIITFGQLKARNSIRDVGRVRGESQDRIDALAESISSFSDDSLTDLMERDSALKSQVESMSARDWIRQAMEIEGFVRNPSIHAAGLLITEETIDEIVPLYADSSSDDLVASQYDMYDIEDLGFLKLDVLGLTTLTLIDRTLERIPAQDRPELKRLPEDDGPTLRLFANKKLEGIFQFEAEGGRRLAKEMEPESKREVVDCIALNRPGPAQYRDEYLARRAGEQPVEYPHDDVAEILESTYGLIIYQEQVMAIARIIGGFTWSESDTMRKAMGKKKTNLMEQLREKFVKGAVKQDYERDFASELFEKLAQFAEYGFNRSHSAAYGEITYQTAYLKAHFPLEFYAAFLTLKSGDRDRIRRIAHAMKDENHQLLPPDVNRSCRIFQVEGDAVRYGLGAIKHVGSKLAESIERERKQEPFRNLDDFLSRISPSLLTEKTVQSLAAGGSFSELTNRTRGSLIEDAPDLVNRGSKLYSEAESGQSTLFERNSARTSTGGAEWNDRRLREAEREALGVVLSGDQE